MVLMPSHNSLCLAARRIRSNWERVWIPLSLSYKYILFFLHNACFDWLFFRGHLTMVNTCTHSCTNHTVFPILAYPDVCVCISFYTTCPIPIRYHSRHCYYSYCYSYFSIPWWTRLHIYTACARWWSHGLWKQCWKMESSAISWKDSSFCS